MPKTDSYTEKQYKAFEYSTEQFDKSIQFIASGALGISFAFIEKIVKLPEAHHTSFLISSWYIFSLIIFTSLVTHYLSSYANAWAIREKTYDTDTEERQVWYQKTRKRFDLWIRGLNIFMIIGLLAGLLCLIYFLQVNMNK